MAISFTRQRFPWRENNRFQLLIDGSEIFTAMLSAIESAQSSIFLEMYLLKSGSLMDRFVDVLRAAAQRGVAVYLLFDDFGARGLLQRDRNKLNCQGIHISYYNPLRYGELRRNLLRDHRKLLVVDGRLAYVGGIGITDAFDNAAHPNRYWHDVAIQAEGDVVADWCVAFRKNWSHWARDPVMELPTDIAADAAMDQAGRVASGWRFGAGEIHKSFVKRARSAERHVWMMTAYFVPSRRLRRALRGAARRGVDVRLLLPGPITDHPAVRYAGRRFYQALLRAGVRIFEYQPQFLHAKVLLCDDWVSLGSSNIDRWNLHWNLEGNQEVEDSGFADRTRQLFEADLQVSEECHLSYWQSRPWYRRAQEWYWGKVDNLLERMTLRLKQMRKRHKRARRKRR
jgi:phosphatidylserine/phosphatidylglycerophosphate/cardiolipin synthase-like enzyme